jgi:hypothetical protein
MNPSDYIYIGDLSERHQSALRRWVGKYRLGAIEHGDLATNRKWTKDMLCEAADLSFYVLFQLMELEDGE